MTPPPIITTRFWRGRSELLEGEEEYDEEENERALMHPRRSACCARPLDKLWRSNCKRCLVCALQQQSLILLLSWLEKKKSVFYSVKKRVTSLE